MNNLLQHYLSEVEIIQNKLGDDYVCKDYLFEIEKIIKIFSEQGHSGSSAPFYANAIANTIRRALLFEPLSEIYGDDSEWVDVTGDGVFQNNRLSSVFKDGVDGKPYYLDAITWQGEDEWDTFHGTVEGITSRQCISFPFTPKKFYIDVYRELYDENNPIHMVSNDVVECGSGTYVYFIKDKSQLAKVWEIYEPLCETLEP